MFKKFGGKTFLINHYKLLIVSSEREENQHFQTLKMDKIPATAQIFLAQIMKFHDFSLTFLVFKNSLTNLQTSLTFPWPWRTSSPKGNDRSPESNVPRSDLI